MSSIETEPASRKTQRENSMATNPFESFKHPVYRKFFVSLLGQVTALNMQSMARYLLVYRLTGSAAIIGAISFALAAPMLLFSLYGGVIADRVQKKSIIIVGNLVSVVVSLCIALTLNFGYLSAERVGSWWILVVASVLQGTILALAQPARQSILPEIVGTDRLMNATALNIMGNNIMRLFGPALAGFLVDKIGFKAVYFLMTGLYLWAAIFMYFVPAPKTVLASRTKVSALSEIKESLRYLRTEPILLFIVCFALVRMVFVLPYQNLLTIFTDDILKVGATGLGILMSVTAFGAIAGSLLVASLPNRGRGLILLGSAAFLGFILTAFSFSTIWYLSMVLVAMIGFGQAVGTSLNNALVQYYVDDKYRGRIMSILQMQFGMMSFGTFTAGVLTEIIGIQWALGSFGAIVVVISILSYRYAPQLRELD
ncbi:MAG: MFS transporter [bacterium]|jgi:MFS family permease